MFGLPWMSRSSQRKLRTLFSRAEHCKGSFDKSLGNYGLLSALFSLAESGNQCLLTANELRSHRVLCPPNLRGNKSLLVVCLHPSHCVCVSCYGEF